MRVDLLDPGLAGWIARIRWVWIACCIPAAMAQSPARTESLVATNPPAERVSGQPPAADSLWRGSFPRVPPVPAGIRALRNIPYVETNHPNQVLDLFLPERDSDKPLPVMIWIHGGAWMGGSHAHPPVLYLVGRGFAVASIQHRFSSHAIWPAQAHDCKAAVRFLRANAQRYHLDPERFGVGGDSSGGHLAAFLGTSGGVAELEGDLGNRDFSSRVQAVVDWYGPTDLTQMDRQSGPRSRIRHNEPNSPESRLMGGPIQEKQELAATANPITYIDRADPPFLILHGDEDPLVPLGQSVILAKALIDSGVEVTLKTIAGAGHGGPKFHGEESRRMIEQFLSRTLKVDPVIQPMETNKQ